MGVIGGRLAIRLLDRASGQGTRGYPDESTAYRHRSKLEVLLGPDFLREIIGKEVLDFGSGRGTEAVEMAERGARRVIGLEIRKKWCNLARQHALDRGVADTCVFTDEWHEPVDVILSLDSFEHFADPAEILRLMHAILKPTGSVFVSFGPTWYHPLGGHIFSVFPFAHLLFTESALVEWRAQYKTDNRRNFLECGLNRMTVARFERLVEASPLRFAEFEAVPIQRLKAIANPLLREFTTAVVRCRLVRRDAAPASANERGV